MKKRILALVCALTMTLGMGLTASAAAQSPSVDAFIAANIDLEFTDEEADITVADISKKYYAISDISKAAKLAFVQAVQDSFIYQKADDKNNFRFLNAFKVTAKNVGSEDFTVAFNAKSITNADAADVWAYDPSTNLWTKLSTVTRNGQIFALANSKYTYIIMTVDGIVPAASRLSAAPTTDEVEEMLVGGKDDNTTVVLSNDILEAPFTGDTTVVYLVFAAVAFAGVAAVSGKKLLA